MDMPIFRRRLATCQTMTTLFAHISFGEWMACVTGGTRFEPHTVNSERYDELPAAHDIDPWVAVSDGTVEERDATACEATWSPDRFEPGTECQLAFVRTFCTDTARNHGFSNLVLTEWSRLPDRVAESCASA